MIVPDLLEDKEAAVHLLTVTALSCLSLGAHHASHATFQADYSWFDGQGYDTPLVRILRSKSGGGQQINWFMEQVPFTSLNPTGRIQSLDFFDHSVLTQFACSREGSIRNRWDFRRRCTGGPREGCS
jgi:hypothetical protein